MNCGRAPTIVTTFMIRAAAQYRSRWLADARRNAGASAVPCPARRARRIQRRLHRRPQLHSALAHPSGDASRIPDDERVVGHVARHDGTGTNERLTADGLAAQDRAVRAEAGAALARRPLIFALR